MIAFGIIHAVQRVTPTIHHTLASMHAAGITNPMVFTDRGELGATRNLIGALRALANASGIDHVCVTDDDLVLSLHAKRLVMEAIELAQAQSAFTMWTIEQNIPHDMRDRHGWIPAPVSAHTWGGSVVMPRGMALGVAFDMQKMVEADPHLKTKPDSVLYACLEKRKVTVFHHLPSLVNHVGMGESTLGNTHANNETAGFRWSEWG